MWDINVAELASCVRLWTLC